jgi:DNA gyrase inhibitor GyrI
MSSGIKKIILIIGIISFVLFMGLIGAAWYMGAFSSVSLTTAEKGPYYFVYLENQGPYYQISNKIIDVEKYLTDNKIKYLHSAGIYFDDPAQVTENELKSYGGFLVSDSVAVQEPYNFIKIERRKVVIAAIEALPMIAPFKVYPAFNEWLENNKKVEIMAPPLELYLSDEQIEVHFAYYEKI